MSDLDNLAQGPAPVCACGAPAVAHLALTLPGDPEAPECFASLWCRRHLDSLDVASIPAASLAPLTLTLRAVA